MLAATFRCCNATLSRTLFVEGFLGVTPSQVTVIRSNSTETIAEGEEYDRAFGRMPHAPPPEVDVFSLEENKIVDRIQLDPFIFGAPIRPDVMHQAVVWHRACLRQGTHQAKTVGEVSGSTKKLYRQKGMGKARAGNNRAPQRRGGGRAFPPLPRDYSFPLPLKVRRMALRSALSAKLEEGRLMVVKENSIASHKTRELEELLFKTGLLWKREELRRKTPSSLLMCLSTPVDKNLKLASRHLDNVMLTTSVKMSVYQLLRHSTLVLCGDTLQELTERLGMDNYPTYHEANPDFE